MPSAPPIVAVSCTHESGSGIEYNVGGPVGSVNRKDNINDVPFELLNPGDTVRIHWRAQPYAERIVLFRSGTQAARIKVCGVRGGPNNERPFITGIDATSRTGSPFNANTLDALQTLGVMVISGRNFDSRVEHVVVEDLRIGDSRTATNGIPKFTDASGAKVPYDEDSACIRIRQAHHITLRSNEIANCNDGIFAGSVPDSNNHLIRNLLVEGNYLHGSASIESESRHQAYLQGFDITVQGNYFGAPRSIPNVGVGAGNQLKTRAVGLVVRYNYFLNGARMLDIVEAEEHIPYVLPYRYAELRARYLACTQSGCLKVGPAELAEYDARHQQDAAKYQAAYVYGNLMHVRGRDAGSGSNPTNLPSNLVHYGYDNSQHDRQTGVLWFFHNTVLWETDRNNLSEVRLFDYGSDFNPGDYYDGLGAQVQNVGSELHYLTRPNGKVCIQAAADCTDWGRMSQTVAAEFGRMRAFNNAFVQKSFTAGQEFSEFQLTRNRWDQLEVTGANFITAGWNVDRDPNDGAGGGYGRRILPAANVYPGGNDNHHVTGVGQLLEGAGVPINVSTFTPLPGSPLLDRASAFDGRLADALKPAFSPVRGAQPGELSLVPRSAWSTLGAVQ
jgi:hypothetical protein